MGMTGRKAHVARLKRLAGPAMERRVGAALFAGAELVQVEAQISITSGAVSGAKHAPSQPGKPPNNDTGVLANNIEAVLLEPLVAEVSSNAPYSAALEYGTSKVAARPFMRPARDKARKKVEALVFKAVKQTVAGR